MQEDSTVRKDLLSFLHLDPVSLENGVNDQTLPSTLVQSLDDTRHPIMDIKLLLRRCRPQDSATRHCGAPEFPHHRYLQG